MAKKMSAAEIVADSRKKLVEEIIENMKKGYIFPPNKWNNDMFRPQNPISGARYKGVNKFRLTLAASIMKYDDPRWLTLNQVKKTEGLEFKSYDRNKGVLCEKWIFERKVKEKDPQTGVEEEKIVKLSRPVVNYFTLYNAQEIEGLPELSRKTLEYDETMKICDEFMKSSICPITETTEGRAYYRPSTDEIVMPMRDSFRDSESFFSTVLHEMGHSTGHPMRLNRDQSGGFGSESYAREELRAELSSYFTEADLGIDLGKHGLHHHVMYLESWVGALQNDVNELFEAIRDADKSTEFLIDRYEQYKERVVEKEAIQENRDELEKVEYDDFER
ncbi:MAG: DUF1738 domain-containing protein [Lachnospiraceae bacterium]|nr:DUF1738 domain-containing protein [Lachnospiraceae bacterium]